MNLANKLTLFRIILVPIMVIIPLFNIQGDIVGIPITYLIINFIFIIASITDKLDGYIARSRNQVTTFGKFLDPIADKILVISALIMLVEMGLIPSWIPIIVMVREFAVSGYRLIAVEKNGTVISASIWGKLKTVTQIIAIVFSFINFNNSNIFFNFANGNLIGIELIINIITTVFILISVVATIFSGLDYIKGCKNLFKDM